MTSENKNKKNELTTYLGKNCRLCRELHGISREEMAIHTGYTLANIYKFERGENNNMLLYWKYCHIVNGGDLID